MALEPERSPGVPGVSGMGVRRAADSAGGMAVPAQWLHEQYVVRRRSSQDLAAETGWSSQYIRDRLRDAGIPVRPAGASKAAGLDPRQLAEWLAEGLPVAAIADRAGYSRSGVYKLMREHALTAVPRPPDPAEEQLATECGRLYRQGLTLRAIARRVGRGEQWVRARVLDAGVPLRCGGPTPVVVGRHALREAIAGGASVAEIAERFNRSTTVVRGWLRAAGIERPAPRVRRGPQLPLLDADVLRRLYVDERFVIAEIATQLGVSADRVRTGLIAAGIPRRRPGHRDDVRAPPTITAKELRALYVRGGLSMVEVAANSARATPASAPLSIGTASRRGPTPVARSRRWTSRRPRCAASTSSSTRATSRSRSATACRPTGSGFGCANSASSDRLSTHRIRRLLCHHLEPSLSDCTASRAAPSNRSPGPTTPRRRLCGAGCSRLVSRFASAPAARIART